MDTLIERKSVSLPGGFMEVREYYSYWYSFFILFFVIPVPPAPQIRLIIRLLRDLHPKIHPKIKSDSLIIILYIKHYLQVLNNLTIMMPCGILLYFFFAVLFVLIK